MSLGAFVMLVTLGAAALALWIVARFPNLGPTTLGGALLQVAVALVSGSILVPVGMDSALAIGEPTGPMIAVFAVVLPSLGYIFVASLWAMRILQRMMHGRWR